MDSSGSAGFSTCSQTVYYRTSVLLHHDADISDTLNSSAITLFYNWPVHLHLYSVIALQQCLWDADFAKITICDDSRTPETGLKPAAISLNYFEWRNQAEGHTKLRLHIHDDVNAWWLV